MHQRFILLRNVDSAFYTKANEESEAQGNLSQPILNQLQSHNSDEVGLRAARSRKYGSENFKVTLETEENSDEVVFRFSPVTEGMDNTNKNNKGTKGCKATNPKTQRRKLGSPGSPRSSTQNVEVRLPQGSPGPSTNEPRPGPSRPTRRSPDKESSDSTRRPPVREATPEPESRAVKIKKVEIEIKRLLEELFPDLAAELEPRSRRNRGSSSNRRGRRSTAESRRRRREREELFYEVEDLEYEIITEEELPKMGRCGNWRVFPKYSLSEREAARQEAELFMIFQNETKPEPIRPPESHESSCCVCYENAATRIVIPCGHLCLCYNCAKSIVTNRATFYGSRVPKLCPICQAAIGLLTRIK